MSSGIHLPPSSPIQTEKCRRYDRQLRLWGDHGQSVIESSRICLIHATATGTEILKSLVLPGIGAFTIVDDKKVTGEDIGNNFFLDTDSLGQSRGLSALPFLLDLNPDVRGNCVDESPEEILRNNPEFFNTFSLVIGIDILEKTRNRLSRELWKANIPFFIVRAYGFISYCRLQVTEHAIFESQPDNTLEDLSLYDPFPKLKAYFDAQDLGSMNLKQHSHTPYVILLYKTLLEWKETRGTDHPKNYQDKKIFKDMLSKQIRMKADHPGVPEDEENFEEAEKAINTSLSPTGIPSYVQEIFKDTKCQNLTMNSSDFWIIARSVYDFVVRSTGGRLPLRGSIPDMFSDTERYVQLQNIYREKAEADVEAVYKNVQRHLMSIGRSTESISEGNVRLFCKNSYNLRMIRSENSIADESEGTPVKLANIFDQNPESDALYYLILLGVDRFVSEYSGFPGALDEDHVETDIVKLKNCVNKVMGEYGLNNCVVKDEYIHEITRYGAAELHAMAAFIGGCTAQEVIKLLTKQYVPIDNLFIYNAMTSESTTIQI